MSADGLERDRGRGNPIRHSPKPGCVRLPLTAAELAAYSEIIDTRSPSEWLLDHLPNALSYPVLNDDERARVGLLYKQSSSFEAKKVGAALVARTVAVSATSTRRLGASNWRTS